MPTIFNFARATGLLALAALCLAAGSPGGELPATMRPVETRYYLMKTDGSDDLAREAYIRMDRMFEEYSLRTAAFAQAPGIKFPFYLFTKADEYRAAGGMPGSAGVFMFDGRGGRLMAIADPTGKGGTWHVVQHEGFHQFAFTSICRNLPVWVNEGLAEYFGESKFTGDAFVTGLIPEYRHQRVAKLIESKGYKPFGEFIAIDDKAWSAKLNISNYDQAWAMVQFLAEGDGGKYQGAFVKYMSALAHGVNGQQAWAGQFGVAGGDASFENAWKKYWTALPENPTAMGFQRARAMMFASILSRSAASGHKFDTFEKFLAAAKAGELKFASDPVRWMPPTLLEEAMARPAPDPAAFALTWAGNVPKLVETLADGSTITVTFTGNHTNAVVKAPAPATTSRPAK